MPNDQQQAEKGKVVSLEKYRGERSKPRGLTHTEIIADPDPPAIHGWIQNGAPKISIENVAPSSAGQLLFVALSLCIDLALLAQQNASAVAQSVDVIS